MISVEQNILIAIGIIFGILLLSLIGLITTYLFLLRKNAFKKEIDDEIKRVDSEKLLSEVHARSVKVLEEAHKKARDILSEAEDFKARNNDLLRHEMDRVTKVYQAKYEAALNEIKLTATKTIHDMPGKFASSMDSFFQGLERSSRQDSQKLTSSLEHSLEAIVRAKNEELEKYKQSRIAKINDIALSLTRDIVKKIIGKDITLDEHEKIVKKSLEEAKSQGLFDD